MTESRTVPARSSQDRGAAFSYLIVDSQEQFYAQQAPCGNRVSVLRDFQRLLANSQLFHLVEQGFIVDFEQPGSLFAVP